MFISKLDIVNGCLRTMGEDKLSTLNEDHPYKDSALDLIDKVLKDVSAQRMWFNTEWLKLQPQAVSKYIMVPTDVMKVDPLTKCQRTRVVQRGNRLYDVGRNTYEFESSIETLVVRLLDFDNVPYEAQAFIRDEVIVQFQSDFDGANDKWQKLVDARDRSRYELKAEHIRQIKANPLFARASAAILRSRYNNFSGHPWHPHSTFPG